MSLSIKLIIIFLRTDKFNLINLEIVFKGNFS